MEYLQEMKSVFYYIRAMIRQSKSNC